jgi:hypothetical protein
LIVLLAQLLVLQLIVLERGLIEGRALILERVLEVRRGVEFAGCEGLLN